MPLRRAIGTSNDFVEPLTRPGGHPLPAVRGEGRGAFGFDPNIIVKSYVTNSDRDARELHEKICFRGFRAFRSYAPGFPKGETA